MAPMSRKVYSTTNPADAELARIALRRHGIESFLENEGGAMYAIGMATSIVPLLVTVAERDGDAALAILRKEAARDAPVELPDLVEISCSCGRTLEIPREMEERTIDCPFCGRPAGGPRGERDELCDRCGNTFPVKGPELEGYLCPACASRTA